MPRLRYSRFVIFLLTSGLAAAVNLLARYVVNFWTSYELAVALAFPFGLATGFSLAKLLVFEPSTLPVTTQVARFTLVNLIALLLVWTISVGLVRFIFPLIGYRWHSEEVAHFAGVASPAIMSYLAHRRFSFAR